MLCEERVKDLEILRSHAKKDVCFDMGDDKDYIVDQLLVQNVIWTERCGTHDQHPYTGIINDLKFYAEGYHDEIDRYGNKITLYTNVRDSCWVDDVICHVASNGFNHVKNYCRFRNRKIYKKKSIEIVEGFLVVEARDHELQFPPVDTIEEMYKKYYGVDIGPI